MLLIVGHPSIGAALETLLRIEDRYEPRRVQSLDHLRTAEASGWAPDVALIDGLLIETGKAETLTMPTIVLSGNAADGARLSAALPNGRGWLRKDATADDLRATLDGALRRGASAGGVRVTTVIVAVATAVVGLLAIALLVLRG